MDMYQHQFKAALQKKKKTTNSTKPRRHQMVLGGVLGRSKYTHARTVHVQLLVFYNCTQHSKNFFNMI